MQKKIREKLKKPLASSVKNDVLNKMFSHKEIADRYSESFGISEYKKYSILVGKMIIEESMLFLNEKNWI